MLKISIPRLFLTVVLQLAVVSAASAFHSDARNNRAVDSKHRYESSQRNEYQSRRYSRENTSYRVSKNERGKLRSQSDVAREVKQKYSHCEILKISLDERKQVYRVRVLMPSGKVRNLNISAKP